MSPDELEDLRNLCKNDESFKELKKIVGTLTEKKAEKERCLSLLESAISNDYDSILITELDLEKPGPKIVYVNDGFCEMTGYSKEEVIGKTPRILQGPKTDPKVLEKLKSRLKSGQCFFGQTINYKKDGTEFINQWDIHPLTDKEGNPTHWVSYQHDISKRKRAEQQLVDTKIEFDQLREETHCTTLDIDIDGNIVSSNQAFRALTGYSEEEITHTKVWKMFPQKYAESLREQLDEADDKQHLDTQEFKTIIKHKSGIPIQVRGTTRLLDLKDKTVIRTEIQNISLQKKVMESLQKRNSELAEKLDMDST